MHQGVAESLGLNSWQLLSEDIAGCTVWEVHCRIYYYFIPKYQRTSYARGGCGCSG